MPYSDSIGRIIIADMDNGQAQQAAQYLICCGIDAIICSDDDGTCHIAVFPEDTEKAKELISEMRSFSGSNASGKEKAPAFVRVTEHLNDIAGSASLFLICGGVLFIIALLKVINLVSRGGDSSILIWVELIIGFIFILLGIRILLQTHAAKKNLRAESRYTLRVIEWFLSTYSTKDLDRQADLMARVRGTDSSPAELRRFIIKQYISREFNVTDPDYLDYLTTEVYLAMYEERKVKA